jgi:phage FluMu protein Com
MRLMCPRCRRVTEMRVAGPNEARCRKCGKVISGRGRQLEALATGTFALEMG